MAGLWLVRVPSRASASSTCSSTEAPPRQGATCRGTASRSGMRSMRVTGRTWAGGPSGGMRSGRRDRWYAWQVTGDTALFVTGHDMP